MWYSFTLGGSIGNFKISDCLRKGKSMWLYAWWPGAVNHGTNDEIKKLDHQKINQGMNFISGDSQKFTMLDSVL